MAMTGYNEEENAYRPFDKKSGFDPSEYNKDAFTSPNPFKGTKRGESAKLAPPKFGKLKTSNSAKLQGKEAAQPAAKGAISEDKFDGTKKPAGTMKSDKF